VLLLDHLPKGTDKNDRYAFGTAQKLIVLDGASYAVKVLKQPARGRLGVLKLEISKDRHGGVRSVALASGKAELAAMVEIDDRTDETHVYVRRPTEDGWMPTALMQRVSEYLEASPEPASQKNIEQSVIGKIEYVRQALNALVSKGYVKREDGPRGAWLHSSIKPYREAQDA
jgi:hypothetical protein